MGRNRSGVAGVAVWLVCAHAAGAAVITFGTQELDDLQSAGVRTEGAFRYQASGAGWDLAPVGNPSAALATVWSGPGPAIGDTVDVTAVGGGLFTFDSIDFRGANDGECHDLILRGYLAGVASGDALSLTGSPVAFQTVPSGFAGPVDLLRIELTGFLGASALITDNIRVTPVPEPASLLTGLLLLAPSRRLTRRRQPA